MSKDLLTLNAILLFVPLGLYLILWDPIFTGKSTDVYAVASETSSVNVFRGQVSEYDNTIKQSKDLVGKYKKLKDSYNAVDKSILDTISKSIPDTIEDVSFVNEVHKLVEKNGLDAGVVSLSPGPDLNGMKTVTFTFHTKGSYESIKNIFFVLEQNIRFTSLRSFTITPPADQSTGDLFTLDIQADVYKLR